MATTYWPTVADAVSQIAQTFGMTVAELEHAVDCDECEFGVDFLNVCDEWWEAH